MFKETKARSVVKTVSWRTLATLTTALLVLIFTGKIKIALAIGFFEVIVKMFLYFFHERLWDRIHFGRKEIVPFVLWFTGLPASGKSTLADAVWAKLSKMSCNAQRLDGEKVRMMLPATGFSKSDRDIHIRRISLLASILESNKVIVVASFISPYKEAREFIRKKCRNFIEVYVSTPLEECERRDPKGLYKRARKGLIDNFTGVNDPYEVPETPEISINTKDVSVDECLKKILDYLQGNKYLI